ncbi:hypothetical protein SALBM311S_04006 [Streptomyces alboniger]
MASATRAAVDHRGCGDPRTPHRAGDSRTPLRATGADHHAGARGVFPPKPGLAIRQYGVDDGGPHLAATDHCCWCRDRHRRRLRAGAVGGGRQSDRGSFLRQRRVVGDVGLCGHRCHAPHRPGTSTPAEGRRTGPAAGGRPQDRRHLAVHHVEDPPDGARPVRGNRRSCAGQPFVAGRPCSAGHRPDRHPPPPSGLRAACGGRDCRRAVPTASRGGRAPLPEPSPGAHVLGDRPPRAGHLHDLSGGRTGLRLRPGRLRHRRRALGGGQSVAGHRRCRSPRRTRCHTTR